VKTFFENVRYIQQQLFFSAQSTERFSTKQHQWLIERLGQCVEDATESGRLQAGVEEEYLGYVEMLNEYDIEDEDPNL